MSAASAIKRSILVSALVLKLYGTAQPAAAGTVLIRIDVIAPRANAGKHATMRVLSIFHKKVEPSVQ